MLSLPQTLPDNIAIYFNNCQTKKDFKEKVKKENKILEVYAILSRDSEWIKNNYSLMASLTRRLYSHSEKANEAKFETIQTIIAKSLYSKKFKLAVNGNTIKTLPQAAFLYQKIVRDENSVNLNLKSDEILINLAYFTYEKQTNFDKIFPLIEKAVYNRFEQQILSHDQLIEWYIFGEKYYLHQFRLNCGLQIIQKVFEVKSPKQVTKSSSFPEQIRKIGKIFRPKSEEFLRQSQNFISNFKQFLLSLEDIDTPFLKQLSCIDLEWLIQHLNPKCAKLNLSQTKIQNLTILENLKNLQYLNLSGCDSIQALENIHELENLIGLDIKFCRKIISIDPIGNLPQLKEINLAHCPVWNLEALKKCTALKRIIVSEKEPFFFLDEFENRGIKIDYIK